MKLRIVADAASIRSDACSVGHDTGVMKKTASSTFADEAVSMTARK